MRRHKDPMPGLLLWPVLLLILLGMGARPLARRWTGVEPPPLSLSAPIVVLRPAPVAEPPKPHIRKVGEWDI